VLIFVRHNDANRRFHPLCIAICSHEREIRFRLRVFRAFWAIELTIYIQNSVCQMELMPFTTALELLGQKLSVLCVNYAHVHKNCVSFSSTCRISRWTHECNFNVPVSAKRGALAYFREQWRSVLTCWYEGVHLDVEIQTEVLPNDSNSSIQESIRNNSSQLSCALNYHNCSKRLASSSMTICSRS
jgi:hypothetical protein